MAPSPTAHVTSQSLASRESGGERMGSGAIFLLAPIEKVDIPSLVLYAARVGIPILLPSSLPRGYNHRA